MNPVYKKVNFRYIYLYTIITIIPLIANYIWVLVTGEYRSEFHKEKTIFDAINLTGVIVTLLISYVVAWIVCIRCINTKICLSSKYDFYFNREYLEKFLIFIIIADILFTLKTGIGKAGTRGHSNISFLFSLINLDVFIYLYYCLYRSRLNKKYIAIIILYMTLQIIKGWTGFILQFFFMEMYYRSHNKNFFKFLLILPFAFFIGAFAYKIMYPFKFLIRFGYYEPITYGESLIKLFERLSFFSHSCMSLQNENEIISLYNSYGYEYTEIKSLFRPVLPTFLFKNKDFYIINTILMQTVYPNLKDSSSSFGGVFYLRILSKIGVTDLIIYCIVLILDIFVFSIIIQLVRPEQEKHYYVSFLLVRFMSGWFAAGVLESICYGWMSIFYTYAIFFCLGILRIKRKRNEVII